MICQIIYRNPQRPQPVIDDLPHFGRPQKATKQLCEILDRKVSEMIFFNNLSFDLVAKEEFKSFCAAGIPGYEVPSRKLISGRLLNECYDRTKVRVHKVKAMHQYLP